MLFGEQWDTSVQPSSSRLVYHQFLPCWLGGIGMAGCTVAASKDSVRLTIGVEAEMHSVPSQKVNVSPAKWSGAFTVL